MRKTKVKKPKITTIKRKCDDLNRQIVRNRDQTCQWCFNPKTRLEVHHIISRNVLAVRYNQDNGITLCASCHRKAHSNPLAFTDLIYTRLGKERYWGLVEKAKQKLTPKHLDWYIEQLERLTELNV